MITVYAHEECYECTKAVKGPDYIRLYDGESVICTFSGISDFSGYGIEGGEWTDPEPTLEELFNAVLIG